MQSLVDELRRAIEGDVDDSSLARALYSSDAANYRVVPGAVVRPRSREDVLTAVAAAREHGVPVTARGAGTSMAGNAVGAGLVLDFSRYLNRIVSLDPGARTAVVQPGVVLKDLQAACAPHGLRFGPDPASGTRCTLGGMIGNNACGAHAMSYGRTADNVLSLTWLTGTGEVVTASRGPGAIDAVPGLRGLADAHLALLRTEFGRFSRQVSGYALEHLLP